MRRKESFLVLFRHFVEHPAKNPIQSLLDCFWDISSDWERETAKSGNPAWEIVTKQQLT